MRSNQIPTRNQTVNVQLWCKNQKKKNQNHNNNFGQGCVIEFEEISRHAMKIIFFTQTRIGRTSAVLDFPKRSTSIFDRTRQV